MIPSIELEIYKLVKIYGHFDDQSLEERSLREKVSLKICHLENGGDPFLMWLIFWIELYRIDLFQKVVDFEVNHFAKWP